MSSSYNQVYTQSFRTSGHRYGEIPPLWTVDLDDDDAILEWFRKAIGGTADDHRERTYIQLKNRDFYAALQSPSLGRTGIPRDKDGRDVTSNTSRVVVNKCYNLVELWVSKLTRFAPAIAVLPANNEYSDRIAADLGKLIVDDIFYQNEVDELLEHTVRSARVFGETYVFVEYDKHRGDYTSPAEERTRARTLLLDSEGSPINGEDGKPLYTAFNAKTGAVTLNLVHPWYVWDEPKPYYKDVDWCIKQSFEYADAARADYPDKADEIQAGTFGELSISYTVLEDNEVPIFEIYHKSTRHLDGGAYIKLTPDCVLEKEVPAKFDDGELPRVRLTNIDVPGEQHGLSLFNNVLLLQVMLNNLYSIAYTNLSLGSHMYWLIPTQAGVGKDKLKNSATGLTYTAPYKPEIAVFKTVGADLMAMITQLEQKILELSGHQGISQGEPPPGVDAAVALGLLEEQENQRANSDIKKYNAFIKKLAKMCLSRAQRYYQKDKKRLVRITGKNGQDRIKAIDMAKFSGPYDVRVYRSTALSESKSLRMQQLILARQNFPGVISDKRFVDLMELGDEDKFYDLATVAVRAAEAENERIRAGEGALEPELYEDHLTHWEVHFRDIQSLSFKEDLPEPIQQQMFDHILVHEALMFDMAKRNVAFAQKLMAVDQYPSFYKPLISLTQLLMLVQQGIDPDAQIQGALPPPGTMPPQGPMQAEANDPLTEESSPQSQGEAPLEEPSPAPEQAPSDDEQPSAAGAAPEFVQ